MVNLRKFWPKISWPNEGKIQISNDSKLFQTFCGMFLIEQDFLFLLSYMTPSRSLSIENDDVITKKIRQNRNFRGEKWKFWKSQE